LIVNCEEVCATANAVEIRVAGITARTGVHAGVEMGVLIGIGADIAFYEGFVFVVRGDDFTGTGSAQFYAHRIEILSDY
jgi:hypothetical protein